MQSNETHLVLKLGDLDPPVVLELRHHTAHELLRELCGAY